MLMTDDRDYLWVREPDGDFDPDELEPTVVVEPEMDVAMFVFPLGAGQVMRVVL